jgi:hypothetical protein
MKECVVCGVWCVVCDRVCTSAVQRRVRRHMLHVCCTDAEKRQKAGHQDQAEGGEGEGTLRRRRRR